MMEIVLKNSQIKRISLKNYEKYFMDALERPDDDHIIFYKYLDNSIEISFSWDNFIIIVAVLCSEIFDIYKDQNMDVLEVKMSDDNPYIARFKHEYLFDRGILENDI